MRQKAFTLIELLVVVAIIALLLSIIMPALRSAKSLAQRTVCASNLRQWSLMVKFYLDDNGNIFPDAGGTGGGWSHGQWWIQRFKVYNDDLKVLLCPTTGLEGDIPTSDGFGMGPSRADQSWGSADRPRIPPLRWTWASYAPNAWIMDPRYGTWGAPVSGGIDPEDLCWGRLDKVPGPYQVPLFADSRWVDVWPDHTDVPNDQEWGGSGGDGYMQTVTLTRHGKMTNVVFMDNSSRNVDIKELWNLKWHREFNIGHRDNYNWPAWMR